MPRSRPPDSFDPKESGGVHGAGRGRPDRPPSSVPRPARPGAAAVWCWSGASLRGSAEVHVAAEEERLVQARPLPDRVDDVAAGPSRGAQARDGVAARTPRGSVLSGLLDQFEVAP